MHQCHNEVDQKLPRTNSFMPDSLIKSLSFRNQDYNNAYFYNDFMRSTALENKFQLDVNHTSFIFVFPVPYIWSSI